MAVEIPVPHHVGDVFRLELQNPGSKVSAFSEVEVDYARVHPRVHGSTLPARLPGRQAMPAAISSRVTRSPARPAVR